MATLPKFEQLGLDSPRPQTGAVSYRATSGMEEAPSEAATKFGETVQNIAFQQQADLNTTRAEDAWNQYKSKALDLSVGNGGFSTLKGGNAVNGDIFKTYSSQLGDARKAIESGLGDNDVRRRFADRANVTDLQFKDSLLRHYTTERDAYEKQTFDGSVATAASMVASAPMDQGIFDTALLNTTRRAEALAAHQGITDKGEIDKIKDNVRDALLTKRIDALLYSNPIAADQLFRLTSDQIKNPETRLLLQHKTREAALSVSATIEAGNLIDQTRRDVDVRTRTPRAAQSQDISMMVPPNVQFERDQLRLNILQDELKDNPNDKNLQRAIKDTTAGLEKMVPASYHPDDPTAQNTSGLPNSRDLAAQLPMMEGKVDQRTNELYGADQTNPDWQAFNKRMKAELHAKVAADVQQLSAIQRQAQGAVIDAILGAQGGAQATQPAGAMTVGGQQQAAPMVTSFSQIQANPDLMRSWQMLDPGVKPALLNLMNRNLDPNNGDVVLYRNLFNRIHLDPGDPKKIDFYKQIVDPTIADRLSMQQIQSLRAEIDRNETPGGRSLNQMRKAADANVANYFKTNIMFTAQPERQIAATMRWNEDVGKMVDDAVAAGDPGKVRRMFQMDTPESVVNQKFLQGYVNSTPAQGAAAGAAAVKAGTQQPIAQEPPVPQPATIDTREKLDAWFQTLPPEATTFVGTDGKIRAIPPRAAAPAPAAGYGARADGTQKGEGFLGPQPTTAPGAPKDQVSTEISVGVNIGGKEVEIPTMVPTLTKPELDYLLAGGDPRTNKAIMDKAVAHAKDRLAAGKSPFAAPGEQAAPPAPAPTEDQMPQRFVPEQTRQSERVRGQVSVAKTWLKNAIPDTETAKALLASTAFTLATRGTGPFAMLLSEGAKIRGEQIGQAVPTERELVKTAFQSILTTGYTNSDAALIKKAIAYGELTPAELKKAQYMLADIEGK